MWKLIGQLFLAIVGMVIIGRLLVWFAHWLLT
jgi:hypothetical protein